MRHLKKTIKNWSKILFCAQSWIKTKYKIKKRSKIRSANVNYEILLKCHLLSISKVV